MKYNNSWTNWNTSVHGRFCSIIKVSTKVGYAEHWVISNNASLKAKVVVALSHKEIATHAPFLAVRVPYYPELGFGNWLDAPAD